MFENVVCRFPQRDSGAVCVFRADEFVITGTSTCRKMSEVPKFLPFADYSDYVLWKSFPSCTFAVAKFRNCPKRFKHE